MTNSFADAVSGTSSQRIELTDLQQVWLTEIGLERRLLRHYRPVNKPASASARVARPDPGQAMAALKQSAAPRQLREQKRSNVGSLQPIGVHVVANPIRQQEDLPDSLDALQVHAADCQACGLQLQRDQLVFGSGDTDQPDWLIVGEAPGKADDRSGMPFQGKAGKLLHAMLVAVGVHPESLVLGGQPPLIPDWSQPASMYFTNMVKCRPLGNRSPTASEAAACVPYLMKQVGLLQPRRILALGRLAAQALLQLDDDVEQLRGKVHYLTTAAGVKIPVVVTWHPAALLMHPQNKASAWADLNQAKQLFP